MLAGHLQRTRNELCNTGSYTIYRFATSSMERASRMHSHEMQLWYHASNVQATFSSFSRASPYC